jgi:hypothetical protein
MGYILCYGCDIVLYCVVMFSSNYCVCDVIHRQGFLVLFRSTSDTIVAGMLLSLAYLKAIQWLAPFKDPALTRIKETSVWQIFFVFLIALLIKMDDVDGDFLAVCLILVFFVNFLILLGQYLAQRCGCHACVSRHVSSEQIMGKDMMGAGAVEMQNAASMVVCPDSSSLSSSSSTTTVSAVGEQEGGGSKELEGATTATTTGGATARSTCSPRPRSSPPPPLPSSAACVTTGGAGGAGGGAGRGHTHSPLHPTTTTNTAII